VVGVAGLGLVEGGGDGVLGRVDDRAGQPFRRGFRPGPGCSFAAAAVGWGDDVVGSAGRGIGVEDAGQGGHPFAVRLLARSEPGAHRPPGGPVGFEGGGPQGLGPHDNALAVELQDQEGVGGRRQRDLVLVEGVDVPGGFDDEVFGLAFAQHLPAPPLDRRLGLVVGTADGFGDRQPAQAVRVAACGQGQGPVGGVDAGQPLLPPGAPLDSDRAEHAGQLAVMARLPVRPNQPVRPGHHSRRAGLFTLPASPQVEMALE
jgi:hypothetical protein